VRGSARIAGRFTLRPAIRVEASLGDPPKHLWGTRQILRLELPKGVRFKRGARKKIGAWTNPGTPVTVSASGRRLTLRVEPIYYQWQGQYDGGSSEDPPISIQIRLRKGSLQPIPRKKRKLPGPIQVRGTFVPAVGGMQGAAYRTWFASNTSTTRIRLKL
jgi:hypothetical protein